MRRCSECGCDISHMRRDAKVCRQAKCRKAAQRPGKPAAPCTRSCPAVGWCHRHRRTNLRSGFKDEHRAPGVAKWIDLEPEGLRTRTEDDPVPEHRPRDEDFLKKDGTPLYAAPHLPEVNDGDVEELRERRQIEEFEAAEPGSLDEVREARVIDDDEPKVYCPGCGGYVVGRLVKGIDTGYDYIVCSDCGVRPWDTVESEQLRRAA